MKKQSDDNGRRRPVGNNQNMPAAGLCGPLLAHDQLLIRMAALYAMPLIQEHLLIGAWTPNRSWQLDSNS